MVIAAGVVVAAIVVGIVFDWAYAAFIVFIAVAVVAPFIVLPRLSQGIKGSSERRYRGDRD